MDLRKFPFDEQNCTIGFESYAFPRTDVTYSWKNYTGLQSYGRRHLPDINLKDVHKLKTEVEEKSHLDLKLFFGEQTSFKKIVPPFYIFRPTSGLLHHVRLLPCHMPGALLMDCLLYGQVIHIVKLKVLSRSSL